MFRVAVKYRYLDLALWILLLASLVFYSYWNPPYILLIVASIIFNFTLVNQFDRYPAKAKTLLWIGMLVNLAPITYFKYYNFFIHNINDAFHTSFIKPELFLPLGISFFTFQQISYLLDYYRGITTKPRFLYYALVVCFFPHLIAGPILIYRDIIPQLKDLRTYGISWRNICIGLGLISLGLFKKVVIADSISPWVGEVFNNNEPLKFWDAWIGALSYTYQIYFDFSGYSDMAIGLGKLFNVSLPVNFNSPYKSTSIIDFWRRWHITLSRFLREYVYIALGGNRGTELRRYVNVFTTMLLGGLWHGAGWNFIVWGGAHGLIICINHLWRKVNQRLGIPIFKPLAWLMTFTSVIFCWVMFRAQSFTQGWEFIKVMTGLQTAELGVLPLKRLACIAFLTIACLTLPENWEWTNFNNKKETKVKLAICFVLIIISVLFISENPSEFLYFQF
nr:MBOAT family O-acyltransferase [Anaerosporomusa subterranea]